MLDHLTDSLLCQWYPVHHPLRLGFLHRGESFLQLWVDCLLFWLFCHHETAVALIRVQIEKKTGKRIRNVQNQNQPYFVSLEIPEMHLNHSVELLRLRQSHPLSHVHGAHHGAAPNIFNLWKQYWYCIGTVWVQAYWYWHGYLVTSVLIAICDMKFTRAQNQVSFTAAKLNLADFTFSLSLARIGFPSSLSSSSAHRGSLTVA